MMEIETRLHETGPLPHSTSSTINTSTMVIESHLLGPNPISPEPSPESNNGPMLALAALPNEFLKLSKEVQDSSSLFGKSLTKMSMLTVPDRHTILSTPPMLSPLMLNPAKEVAPESPKSLPGSTEAHIPNAADDHAVEMVEPPPPQLEKTTSPPQLESEIGFATSTPSPMQPTTEKRSRRKPTLEDIVRRMKEETTYCSGEEDSEDDYLASSLSIDMERGYDENRSIGQDDSIEERHQKVLLDDLEAKSLIQKHLLAPPKSEFLSSSLPSYNGFMGHISSMPSTPISNDGSFVSHNFMQHKMNNSMNSWFPPLPFEGMPPFPFPPGPMDPCLPNQFLPMFGNNFSPAPEAEKDYLKCQYCERTFRRQKNLENHIENTHHGKGPIRRRPENGGATLYFKCTHCPYTTKHQSNLYVHLRIHTGERPYICGACGVQYSQSHSLKSHIINKHEGIMSFYIKEKRTRSPRGIGYITTHVPPDVSMFKMPPPLMPIHGASPGGGMLDIVNRSAHDPVKAALEQAQMLLNMPKNLPPLPMMNGLVAPIYHELPMQHGQQEKDNSACGHLGSGGRGDGKNDEPPAEAIDLSKKSAGNDRPNGGQENGEDDQQRALRCSDNVECNNCIHAHKLKLLRMNVLRMLSILVPNLNFEEKGISPEGDSVDELLQDVIESNMKEEDMSE